MTTETNYTQVIINRVTQAQYDEMTKVEGELYFIKDAQTKLDGSVKLVKADGTTVTFTGIETLDLSDGVNYATVASNYQADGTIDTALKAKELKLTSANAGDGISITRDADDKVTISNTNVSAVWGNIEGTLSNQKDLQSALDAKIPSSEKGVASGVATLGTDGKVPTAQLPSYVDDVIEAYTREGTTPLASDWLSLTEGGEALTPETGKIYVVLSDGVYKNKTLRWGGSTYVLISEFPDVDNQTIVYDSNQKLHTNIDENTLKIKAIQTEQKVSPVEEFICSPLMDVSIDSETGTSYTPSNYEFSYAIPSGSSVTVRLFSKDSSTLDPEESTIIDQTNLGYCSWGVNGEKCVLKEGTPVYIFYDTETGYPSANYYLTYTMFQNNLIQVGTVGSDEFKYTNPVTSTEVVICSGMSAIHWAGKGYILAWGSSASGYAFPNGTHCISTYNSKGEWAGSTNGVSVTKTTYVTTGYSLYADKNVIAPYADTDSNTDGIVIALSDNSDLKYINGQAMVKSSILNDSHIDSNFKEHESMRTGGGDSLFAMADGVTASFTDYNSANITLTNKTINYANITVASKSSNFFTKSDESNMVADEGIVVGGVNYIAGASFAVGDTWDATLDNLIARVNEASADWVATKVTASPANGMMITAQNTGTSYNDKSCSSTNATIVWNSEATSGGADASTTYNNTITNLTANTIADSSLAKLESETKVEAKLTSLAKVQSMINASKAVVDDTTIEYNSSNALQVKDGGLTASKIADNSIELATNESKATAVLLSKLKIQEVIEGERTTSATLTNKTIDVDNNSLSNVEVDNFKSGVIVTTVGTTGSDDSIPTEKAVRSAISAAAPGVDDATIELFDNTSAGGSSHDLRVKDNGLTASKVADDSVSKTETEAKADIKFTSLNKVNERIDAELDTYTTEARTFTNKTLDADDNTIQDLKMTNLASANAEFASTETTAEAKASAKVPSLAKVNELIDASTVRADNITIESAGPTGEEYLQLKDGGITAVKVNDNNIAKSTTEDKEDVKFVSLTKVNELIASSTVRADDITIESAGATGEEYLQLKDGGITTPKISDTNLAKSDNELKANVKLASLMKVNERIDSELDDYTTEERTFTNKTINAYTIVEGSNASGSLYSSNGANFSAGDTVTIGSKTVTAGTDFTIGSIFYESIENLASCDFSDEGVTLVPRIGTGNLRIVANDVGSDGNSIVTSVSTSATIQFSNTTLTGGVDTTRTLVNTITNLVGSNIADSSLAKSEDEEKADVQLISLKKVNELIEDSEDKYDDETITRNSSSKLEVKDNSLTIVKINEEAITLGGTESKEDALLVSQAYVDESITSHKSTEETLTNKTINADNNTISNLEADNFKSGVVVDSTTGIAEVASASDTKLATEKAIATLVDNKTLKLTTIKNSAITVTDNAWSWTLTGYAGYASIEVLDNENGGRVGVIVREVDNDIVISGTEMTGLSAIPANTFKVKIVK